MAQKTLLGVDVGTTGCKATLYSLDGNPLRGAYVEYPLLSPRPGWAEEDPEHWWRAVVSCLNRITQKEGISRGIVGVGVGCTNALVLVDKDGTPLRLAIMQLDQRTVKQAQRLRETAGDDCILQITGNRMAPGSFSAPLILWVREHEPHCFETASKFLVPGGFIVHRLTGRFTMDHSRASTTGLFDIRARQWSEELCEAARIPREKLPDLFDSWQIVGEVTPEAAAQTGLLGGTPVVAGCMDTVGAAVGSGVVAPHQAFAAVGTVARVGVVLQRPEFDHRLLNCCHAVPDLWLSFGVMNGAGVSLRWFRDQFGQCEVTLARLLGRDPYEILTEEAEKSPPGASGLIYLPYLAAERSPIWDPCARGVLFGLTVAHQRGDVIRAILEGVAFSIHHNLSIAQDAMGMDIDSIRIGGGAARSPLWNQIIADITGKRLMTLSCAETETLGAAILAGVGTGVYSDFQEATQRTLKLDRQFTPQGRWVSLYRKMFRIYRLLYQDLRQRFQEVVQVQNISTGAEM